MKIGINGFGRIGRLAFRCAWEHRNWEITQINDPAGEASTWSHLINFDSTQGRWKHNSTCDEETIIVEEKGISCTQNQQIEETDWSNCDLVIEASGQMKTTKLLKKISRSRSRTSRSYCAYQRGWYSKSSSWSKPSSI